MGEIANRMLFEWISKKIRQKTDINDGVEQCRNTSGAVLIDVREADEYRRGHIPGAVNVPLSDIHKLSYSKTTPVFLYCLRGSRSKQASEILCRQGYEEVYSIGGINKYKGEVEN